MIKYATQKTASTNAVNPASTESFKTLFHSHFEEPAILFEKTRASTFIPADFREPTRCDASVITSSLIIFDVDQKPDTEERIEIEEVEDALLDMNLEHFVYTSHSHTAAAPRFRVVIAASRPFYPAEHSAVGAAMLEQLDDFIGGRLIKVVDRCWKVPSQCYYAYAVHPERKQDACSFYNPGKPADIDDLKLQASTYGIDQEYKPGASKGVNTGGAIGRSYELNRIVGGMIRSASVEEIAQRLYDHDHSAHAHDPYFRDPQYPRNRPRPGESEDAAAWRSCMTFTRSHVASLKRKISGKKVDEEIKHQRAQSKDPMPTHEATIKVRKVQSKPTKNGAESYLMECQVMSGEHAGRHFWHRLYGQGSSDFSIKISESFKTKMAKATGEDIKTLKEMIKAEGKLVRARIKHNQGKNGYQATNDLGDIFTI